MLSLIIVVGLFPCIQGFKYQQLAPSIHHILVKETTNCVVLSNGRLPTSMIPLQSQRIDITKGGIANNFVKLLKNIANLCVIDLDLGTGMIDVLAKPELNQITLITKRSRETLPEILKNRAKVFKLSEDFENEILFEIWGPATSHAVLNIWKQDQQSFISNTLNNNQHPLNGVPLKFMSIYPDSLPSMETMIMETFHKKYGFESKAVHLPLDEYALSISKYSSVQWNGLRDNIFQDCVHKDLLPTIQPPPPEFREGIEQYEYYNYAWQWGCLGFEPTIFHWTNSSEEEWGQKLKSELISGQVHFSIGFLTLHALEANSNIIRSIVYANFDEYAVTQIPQPTQNFFNLFQVFDMEIWIALLMGLSLFTAMCLIFIKVYNSLGVVQRKNTTIMDAFILIFTGFTEPDPISWFNEGGKGGQLLVLMWSLFAFFITAAYSSMLLSFLTLPNFEKVVQTPKDILDLKKTVMMFPVDEDGVDLETLQATFSDDVAFWANNHKEIILSQTEEEITNAVIKEGKILINSKRSVLEDDAFAGYLDQVRFSTDPLINGNNDVLFIGRNFPWTDLIIDDMLRMSAGGILDHYFFSGINPNRLQILEPRNYPQSSYTNNPIKFEQMFFTFIFWIGGMIVATFTFFTERVGGVQT